jgi:hypothetical protein
MMLGLLQVSGDFRIYEPGAALAGQVFPTPRPEVNGKFAPVSGKALLLIGDDKDSVDAHFDSTVSAPGGVSANVDLGLNDFNDLDYLVGKYPNSTLSIGVTLNKLRTDEQIDTLLKTLAAYNRPVYLRLGFGSDDAPDVYVSAWKKFEEQIQVNGSLNVALVWESASCDESGIADFYPGDEFVDWVGISYCDGISTDAKMQFAREHLKPVMLIAESQDGSWDEWFAPFFKFVTDNNDVIRAVAYVNNGQLNNENLKQWKDETKQSFWLRGGPSLFDTLGFMQ